MIEKSTVIENTWKEFYDRIKEQVVSTTITGGVDITVQNYVSTFPDKLIDSKSNYPILVIDTPKFDGETFTMGKETLNGSIDIEIYTNQAEAADKFLSQIIDSIETHKYTLRTNGLSMVKLSGITPDNVSRDKINLHTRMASFTFKFRYVKTGAY